MSSNDEQSPARRHPVPRWGVYAILAAILVALYAVDTRLKTSDTAGYLPESATWRLEARDLPGAWKRWQGLPPGEAMRERAPATLQSLAAAVRKMTGVRPTPQRLALWLGPQVLAGGAGDAWCVSTRPGIMLRLASVFVAPLRAAAPRDGEDSFWSGYAWGWRDGHFLLASSSEYLDVIMTEGRPVPRTSLDARTLALSWRGSAPGMLKVSADDEVPVALALPGAAAPEGTALHRPGAGTGAMLEFASRGGSTALLERLTGWMPAGGRAGTYRSIASSWWEAYCPLNLSLPAENAWFAGVFDADFRAEVPTIEMGWAEFGTDETARLGWADVPRHDHFWGDTAGALVPVAGDARAWAAVRREDALYLASHEHRIPALLDAAPDEAPDGVFALRVDWAPFGGALADLVRRAAREELLPGHNEDDVAADFVPLLEGLQAWGRLDVMLHAAGDGLQGSGVLAGAAVAP